MANFAISNDPVTSLPRRVDAFQFEEFAPELGGAYLPYIKLKCRVFQFKNNTIVRNSAISDFVVELLANNTTRVDPATGDYLFTTDENGNTVLATEGGMGEYDFIKQAIAAGVYTVAQFIELAVARADQYGRFNI
jgi:hypothetical protein